MGAELARGSAAPHPDERLAAGYLVSETDQLMLLPPQLAESYSKHIPGKGLYAAQPGTGPEGETCGACKHCHRAYNGRYRKCELVRRFWTGGPGTDIKARMAACLKWEAA